jgi:hypothetical protein
MVKAIFITSQKHFIPPSFSNNENVNNKFSKYEHYFDDWTTNFTDLLYWDTDLDLNNKTLVEALHKLSVAISRLEREGVTPILYNEDEFLLPKWWFGNVRISADCGLTKPMPMEERKSILLLHLLNLYNDLTKIHKKNKNFYCYSTF